MLRESLSKKFINEHAMVNLFLQLLVSLFTTSVGDTFEQIVKLGVTRVDD
jgi:hypothetical protein